MNTCTCSTYEDISNIPTSDIAISTVMCKLADVNDVIVTQGNSVQQGTAKRYNVGTLALTCCSIKRI